jgi:predicted GIY-YIG superfamily endonuclease
MSEKSWVFYIIANKGRTYAGVSPDPVRRLRQHNGEICGGAKYTTSTGPGWKHVCLVHGFRTHIEALQFEWAVKHERPRGKGGMAMRVRKLHQVLAKERWTSRAPLACEVPLTLEWVLEETESLPACEEINLPDYVLVRRALESSTIGVLAR